MDFRERRRPESGTGGRGDGGTGGTFWTAFSNCRLSTVRQHFQLDGWTQDADGEQTPAALGGKRERRRRGRREACDCVALRPVTVGRARRTEAVGSEYRGQPRDRRRESVGRERGRAEKRELSAAGAIGTRGEDETDDRRSGRPRLELQAQECQKRLAVARRCR